MTEGPGAPAVGATGAVGAAGAETLGRRDRQRAATEAEIKSVARAQLVASGGGELSLRGIAREMGMTAPGLYRYFASLQALGEAMCHDYLDEVAARIDAALEEAGSDLGVRMHAAIRTFRSWSVEHPAEFGLLFRSRGPGPVAYPDTDLSWAEECAHTRRFAGLFFELFAQMWQAEPFDLPDDDSVPGDVVVQVRRYADALEVDLPDGALWVFVNAWVRLYSVIALDVLGQLGFLLTDAEPYFEAELRSVAATVGVDYVPPSG